VETAIVPENFDKTKIEEYTSQQRAFLSREIRAARAVQGLSVQALTNLTGVGRRALDAIESNTEGSRWDYDSLVRLCYFFDLPLLAPSDTDTPLGKIIASEVSKQLGFLAQQKSEP
jgi:transcriptional regulator with XRE-family HTH domain